MSWISLTFSQSVYFPQDTAAQESTISREVQCPEEPAPGYQDKNEAENGNLDKGLTCEMIFNMMDK